MKTFLSLTAIALSVAALPLQASAQAAPPACQQYIRALNVCGADLVKYYELTDPRQAVELRATLDKAATNIATGLREQIKLHGELAVAQRCAASPGKEQLQAQVADLVTLLNAGGAMSESPRVFRRLQSLREWSNEQVEQVLT
jgi:hypothetical protein